MMFYRETNSINGIKRLSDQDGTDDNDDAQVKTTNFSISEILRPEFGQRIKSEPSYPDAVSLKRENISAFSLVNNPSTYPLYSFGNIFRRYKNLMFSESHQDRQIKSRTHQTTEFAPLVTEQSELTLSSTKTSDTSNTCNKDSGNAVWPAWVYCTRYSDRPSAGPRAKKTKLRNVVAPEEKRPRTAFTNEQLNVLKREFNQCRYLTEKRRITLAKDLNLTESQIKIWFQNKRAKIKKTSDAKNTLALNLIAEGLYNHSTVNKSSCSSSDDD